MHLLPSIMTRHDSKALPLDRPCSPPQTCYYAKVFEKDVPKALEILADILQVGRRAGRTALHDASPPLLH